MSCRKRPRRQWRPGAPATTCARRSVAEAMSQAAFPFKRVAVVNRGEPAMRLINAVREWNAEGRPALRVIAVYTAADRQATFVRQADEAVLIGPEDPGAAFEGSPYLDYAELERALRACRADAVWPGWGLVSEKAEFAELCERLGITFIGPSAEVMRRLGDKIESKLLAERAGVPLAPWSGGPVADLAAAREAAESIGYPLMVKATAGGGGRGIRLCRRPGTWTRRSSAPARRRRRRPGTRRCSWSGPSAAGGTSRCRWSPTRRARCGRWACGTAACSGATRRSSRNPPPPRWTRSRRSCSAGTPPSWPARPATSTPGRWSSSTSRARSCCRSWRSTPGSR